MVIEGDKAREFINMISQNGKIDTGKYNGIRGYYYHSVLDQFVMFAIENNQIKFNYHNTKIIYPTT